MKSNLLLIAGLMALSACGSAGPNGENQNVTASAELSPKDQLATINAAYSGNSIQARRVWGGKRVTVGGAFDSAGRNADGSTSVLISPGDMPPTLGELNVGKEQNDFVAKLEKGQEVAMNCIVDPEAQGFTTTFVDCVPART